ncbi:hypothetical protein MKW94_015866, partial [Papaver nudicaule]|nr:hypothetical protein [Papaver nudicaule]
MSIWYHKALTWQIHFICELSHFDLIIFLIKGRKLIFHINTKCSLAHTCIHIFVCNILVHKIKESIMNLRFTVLFTILFLKMKIDSRFDSRFKNLDRMGFREKSLDSWRSTESLRKFFDAQTRDGSILIDQDKQDTLKLNKIPTISGAVCRLLYDSLKKTKSRRAFESLDKEKTKLNVEKAQLVCDIETLSKTKIGLESDIQSGKNEKETLQRDVQILNEEKAMDLELLDNEKENIASEIELMNREKDMMDNEKENIVSEIELLNREKDMMDNEKENIASEIELMNKEKDTMARDNTVGSSIEVMNREKKLMLASEKTHGETAKQTLELEIEQLKGDLNVLKHQGGDDYETFNKMMDEMSKNLEETQGELESLEDLNQTLVVMQGKSNDELQEARKELITGLRDMSSGRALIGVKRMGELESKPFHEACKRKFGNGSDEGTMMCSAWEEYLRDPDWHPYKIIKVGNTHQ